MRHFRRYALGLLLGAFLYAAAFAGVADANSPCPILFKDGGKEAVELRDYVEKDLEKLDPTLKLRYCHSFEICELPALPEVLRSAVFTSLGTVTERFSGIQTIVADAVESLVRETNATQVVELASGGGQGLRVLAESVEGVDFLATDLFPQPEFWANEFKSNPRLKFHSTPVSFQNFDRDLGSVSLENSVLLTVSAFHHVNNTDARLFLERAARTRASVVIVEPLERDVRSALVSLGAIFPSLLTPILAKNVTFRQRLELALFHWVLPIVPMVFAHDGIRSTLRQRTVQDWAKLIQGLPFSVEYERGLGPLKNFTVVKFVRR